MRDWNLLSDDEFRAEVDRFVETNLPADLRFCRRFLSWSDLRPWYQILSREGWLAPGWPREHGGMGLSPAKHLIYIEQMTKAGAPRLQDQGVMSVGPMLIQEGTREQQEEYLPKILSGEHLWCQGYSEPEAGSDLASLRTEAHVEGGEIVINGGKIWTSWAREATHMYALVRTDKTVSKHAGLSIVIIDLSQKGVERRVIPMIESNGDDEICQVLLNGARAPLGNLIGKWNDGWRISKGQLGLERMWAGSPRESLAALERLSGVAQAFGRQDDPDFVERFTELEMDVLDLCSMYERCGQMLREGQNIGTIAALLKIWATETNQRINSFTLAEADEAGSVYGEVPLGAGAINVVTPFLLSRPPTIYGGSSEIQRNILAKRVLNLPDYEQKGR